MSKSISSPLGALYMFDAPKDIERKIAKAVTDTDGEVRYDWEKKPGISNLLEIYASLSGESPSAIADRYTRYGELKSDLAARITESLAPARARYHELMETPRLPLRGGRPRRGEGARRRRSRLPSRRSRHGPHLEQPQPPVLEVVRASPRRRA